MVCAVGVGDWVHNLVFYLKEGEYELRTAFTVRTSNQQIAC